MDPAPEGAENPVRAVDSETRYAGAKREQEPHAARSDGVTVERLLSSQYNVYASAGTE